MEIWISGSSEGEGAMGRGKFNTDIVYKMFLKNIILKIKQESLWGGPRHKEKQLCEFAQTEETFLNLKKLMLIKEQEEYSMQHREKRNAVCLAI